MPNGTLYWLTGLSGSGKTTIGRALSEELRKSQKVIFLDGDTLREVFYDMYGHSKEERLDASMHYARLCKMLVEQGVDVVCATISMFHKTREWNQKNIAHYIEVYIRVPMDELEKRDSKQIYSRSKKRELINVVGVDIEAEEPINPNVIIDNYGDIKIEKAVESIIDANR